MIAFSLPGAGGRGRERAERGMERDRRWGEGRCEEGQLRKGNHTSSTRVQGSIGSMPKTCD